MSLSIKLGTSKKSLTLLRVKFSEASQRILSSFHKASNTLQTSAQSTTAPQSYSKKIVTRLSESQRKQPSKFLQRNSANTATTLVTKTNKSIQQATQMSFVRNLSALQPLSSVLKGNACLLLSKIMRATLATLFCSRELQNV